MKLIVSLLLCFVLVGALADHKHEPFGDDVVPAIEEKLKQALENYRKLKMGPDGVKVKEITIQEAEEENGDEGRIALRTYNISVGDVQGKWEVTRPNENQLKIKVELTQNGMWHDCQIVISETKIVGPGGETKGKKNKTPVVLNWKQNSGKVSMTVNLIDGNLIIDDLKSEVNVPNPEVNILGEDIKKNHLEDDIARQVHSIVLGFYEDLVKGRNIRKHLHEILTELESKRGEQQQQEQQSA